MRILFIFRNIFYPLMKHSTFLTVNFTFLLFCVKCSPERRGMVLCLLLPVSISSSFQTVCPDWQVIHGKYIALLDGLSPGNTLPWLTVIPGEHIAWFQDWARKTVLLCPPVLFTTPCQTAMMKTRIQGQISAFGVPCVYRQPEKCKSGKY